MSGIDFSAKLTNLMQFARKAGKIVAGTEACLRALHSGDLHLIIIAADTAPRTIARINNATAERGGRPPVIQFGTQADLSAALGLHLTGVYGIRDRQFAAKMTEYNTARVED